MLFRSQREQGNKNMGDGGAETSSHRILGAYPTIPRSDDNKDAVIAPISLCPNRGTSADFVLISGQ